MQQKKELDAAGATKAWHTAPDGKILAGRHRLKRCKFNEKGCGCRDAFFAGVNAGFIGLPTTYINPVISGASLPASDSWGTVANASLFLSLIDGCLGELASASQSPVPPVRRKREDMSAPVTTPVQAACSEASSPAPDFSSADPAMPPALAAALTESVPVAAEHLGTNGAETGSAPVRPPAPELAFAARLVSLETTEAADCGGKPQALGAQVLQSAAPQNSPPVATSPAPNRPAAPIPQKTAAPSANPSQDSKTEPPASAVACASATRATQVTAVHNTAIADHNTGVFVPPAVPLIGEKTVKSPSDPPSPPDVDPEPAPQPARAPSQGIALRLADDRSTVTVRLAEHAGEIRATVQTPDRELAGSLRSELPELVGRLRQSGFHGEIWGPAGAARLDMDHHDSGYDAFSHRESGRQQDGRQSSRHHQQEQHEQSHRAPHWFSFADLAQESIS